MHSVGLDVARFDYSGNARAFIQCNERQDLLHVFPFYMGDIKRN